MNALEQVKDAFCKDDAAGVRELIERHPELKSMINEPIAAFDSPVITCARSREMLDVLLAAGADINAKSRWWAGGFGLLHGARPELAAYAIARGARIDVHAAARLGMLDKLKELIATETDLVHARGGDGQTPLHFASSVEVAEFLLARGAAIDARDIDHESTPPQYMVRDRQKVARYLVERGCRTDLLMASALGNLELVRKHLDDDPNCVRMNVSEEYFPKENPRSGGTIYIWTLGANKSAHAVAREFGHEQVLSLLLERSPDDLRLAVACELGDEAGVERILAGHPELVPSLPAGETHKIANAARDNNIQAVRLMLRAGWPVDAVGQHGATPLHWAAFHGNAEMAELILQRHPPLEVKDADFKSTPLGWAIHGSEHGWHSQTGNYPATVEALLRAGAKAPAEPAGSQSVRQILQRPSSR